MKKPKSIKRTLNILIIALAALFIFPTIVHADVVGYNSSGWAELYENGSIIQSAFTMYDSAWNHLFFTILFFVFQAMLFLKTKSPALCFFTTGLTVAIVWLNPSLQFLIHGAALWIFFVYMVMLIAAILFKLKEGF